MAQAVGRDERIAGIGVRQQHSELVAADAEGPVPVAQRVADGVGHAQQQLVAGGVALVVVDHLEIVEVDEQQRHRHLVTSEEVQLPVELLLEGAVVAQAGEAVVERVLASLPIEHLELGLGLGEVIEGLQERPRHHDGHEQHHEGEADEHEHERVARRRGHRRPDVDEPEVGTVVGFDRAAQRWRPSRRRPGPRPCLRARATMPLMRTRRLPSGLVPAISVPETTASVRAPGDDGVGSHVHQDSAGADAGGGRGRREEVAQADLRTDHAAVAARGPDDLGGHDQSARAIAGRRRVPRATPPGGAARAASMSSVEPQALVPVDVTVGEVDRHLRAVQRARDADALDEALVAHLERGDDLRGRGTLNVAVDPIHELAQVRVRRHRQQARLDGTLAPRSGRRPRRRSPRRAGRGPWSTLRGERADEEDDADHGQHRQPEHGQPETDADQAWHRRVVRCVGGAGRSGGVFA